jgi:predicted dehydrogenase
MVERSIGAIVVGTGFGVLTHLRALRAAGFEVHALVGRDPEKTADRARRMDVAQGLTSLAEALTLPGVEAVTVATPPHTHAEIVLEAVAAGKHVLCEKPFARNTEEALEMARAAEAAGVVHLLGTEFRYATGQALATRAIHDGVIGEPRLATFLLHVPALADPAGEVPDWWSRAEDGGGWLGAYASHVIDQMLHMFGPMEGLSADVTLVSDRDWSSDDTYTVHFRTRSGLNGVLQSSAGAWGAPVFCSRVVGSKGTLWIEGDAVHVADAEGVRSLDVPPGLALPAPVPPPAELLHTAYDMLHAGGIDLAPYTRLCEDFRARILGEPGAADSVAATFHDGAAGQAVLDAIRQASRERGWVKLDA